MKKTFLIIAALLAAAFSLSGCLSSEPRLSHQEYEREMQAIAHDMNGEFAGLLAGGLASEQDFMRMFREMSGVMRDAADRVGDINPPEEIDEPHRQLADALDEAADVLEEVIDNAEDGDVFGAMEALDDAPDDLDQKVREALTEIRTAGYYIGGSEAWD